MATFELKRKTTNSSGLDVKCRRCERSVAEETLPKGFVTDDNNNSGDTEPYFSIAQCRRFVYEFRLLRKIEKGGFGEVFEARDKMTEKNVALKRIFLNNDESGDEDQLPFVVRVDIKALLKCRHPNIVAFLDLIGGLTWTNVYLCIEFVEHELYKYIRDRRRDKCSFLAVEVRSLMSQLLKAVHHIHSSGVLHRDLKITNILLTGDGMLKVADFGLACDYTGPVPFVGLVGSLWYRAPELLLGCDAYSSAIDMWSVGCVFAEILFLEPLFSGHCDTGQLNLIFKYLGTPSEVRLQGGVCLPTAECSHFYVYRKGGLRQRVGSLVSEAGASLLECILAFEPYCRLTAAEALEHRYFTEESTVIDPTVRPK